MTHSYTQDRRRQMGDDQADTCRVCGTQVAVTLDEDGRPEQLDSSGQIVCVAHADEVA